MKTREVIGYLKQPKDITIILGAGASRTAGILTAPELVKKINTDFAHCLSGLSDDDRKSYGKVMGALSPSERKSLLGPMLTAAKINWGHLALACILNHRNVQRVLTFNFDLLVERTTNMTGLHLPVYDFGQSPTKNISDLAQPAIIHLHGQSYGLRLLNSDEETEAHADALRPLLADSLRNHLTLVIGYSGEADAAFAVMQAEFSSNSTLIWLGYEDDPKPHLKPSLAKKHAHYIGGCDFDRTMIDLAQGLGCFPPDLIKNPPKHVLSMLQDMKDYPVTQTDSEDMLTDTRDRLNNAADHWITEGDNTAKAQAALVSGKAPPPAGDPKKMDEGEKTARAWDNILRGNALFDEARTLSGAAQTEKFAEACAKYAEALRIKPDKHEALNNWGNALLTEARTLSGAAQTEKLAEACAKYAEALRIKPDKHEALYNWGNALLTEALTLSGAAQTEKFAAACAKYAEALRIKPDKHEALNNWGNALSDEARTLSGAAQTEKFAEAYTKYAEALQIKPDKHEALNNWGSALLTEAGTLSGAPQLAKLTKARETILRAKSLTGKPSYNMACLEALCGNPDAALGELEACAREGTLPDRAHLDEDRDMDTLRDHPRFLALLDA